MPSGATHDRITLWMLPLITAATLIVTRSSDLTLIVAGAFLFGGLMLSPDLDLRSRPYKRWGWLRWIWIPYQKSVSHRSTLSHGLIVGTMLRVVYLMLWIALVSAIAIALVLQFSDTSWSWETLQQQAFSLLNQYRYWIVALFIGLELGAISHIASDTIGSTYKRWQKYGWQGLFGGRKSRRTNKSSSSRSRRRPSTRKPRQSKK
ncbi:metal-binding protein [Roseofilum casamattae]|uniref:Metal-binding protein n=1 Tax=Roseofilum casamattae BLCC-M143 TaxID=3022442 RepID=A0ABT7BR24_9CYAN|nr:metal-binding protein [Roseofilum casamattae]MDJ1181647.1 metal-binding protein [Roseofilum casamattae BLCC-M143]